jgi:hypothetical protein
MTSFLRIGWGQFEETKANPIPASSGEIMTKPQQRGMLTILNIIANLPP